MRVSLLIALNFLREQKWVLVVLIVWVLISSAIADTEAPGHVDDVLFFLKQQAMYGVAFTVFLAASALHNERKSRRILAVLSKGITRFQYLFGLLLGVGIAAFLYCASMAAAGAVVFRSSRLPQPGAWIVIVLVLVACLLTGAVSTLFATFMSPLFAALATAFTIGLMSIAARMSQVGSLLFPIYWITEHIVQFDVGNRLSWEAAGPYITSAIVESAIIAGLAAAVFRNRDIAVAVE